MIQDVRRLLSLAAVFALVMGAFVAVPAAAQDATEPPAGASDDACVEPEASEPPGPDETLSMPEDVRIALFNGVWEGIRDFYVDPETNGLDWEAIGDEYAPLVIQTDNAHEVYSLLSEMVELLDDDYTNFYSPEDLGDPESFDPTYGGIGALVDGTPAADDIDGLRILYVFDGGSAKDAGLDARDVVVAVEGDSCARIADIRGPEGTPVTLTVVSPGEAPRDVELERRRINPLIEPVAHRLEADPSVGYLRLISLVGQETIDGVEQALTLFSRGDEAVEGLIIDLRADDQGAPGVVIELLTPFVEGVVGEFHSRLGNDPIEIAPSELAPAYADVPLVVLVDENSEAEAEQLAAILQDQGRAIIVGEQTSGQTHGTQPVDFLDGSLLQIVSFGFQLPDGSTLEGQGVTPDVVVEGDWLAYPESEDPGLLAALKVIDDARAAAASATEAPVVEGTAVAGPPAATEPPAAEGSEAPAAEGSQPPAASDASEPPAAEPSEAPTALPTAAPTAVPEEEPAGYK